MTEEDKLVKDALSIATYGTLSQVQEQIARNAVRVGLAARIPAPAPDVVEQLACTLHTAFMSGDTNKLTTTALPGEWPNLTPSFADEWRKVARAALSTIPIPATGEVERDEATDRIRGTLLREALLEHTENIPDRHEIDWGDAADTFLTEVAAMTAPTGEVERLRELIYLYVDPSDVHPDDEADTRTALEAHALADHTTKGAE